MTYGLLLLINRLVGLVVGNVQLFQAILSPMLPSPLYLFLIKVAGILSSFLQKIPGHGFILFFSRGMVELHQADLHLLMPRNAVLLPLLGAKSVYDGVCQALRHLQKLILPRGFVIGHSRLHHMAGTVKFMAFVEVLPAVLRLLDDKVGIQIAVRLLGLFNDADDLVRPGLQSGVRFHCQGKGDTLQPFRHIAVLEHHPVKFTGLHPRRNAEIFDSMALFHPRYFVV